MSDQIGLAGLLAAAPAGPPELYAVFCGNLDQGSVGRIMHGVTTAIANRVPRLHLLFQSSGGLVGDGVCLYNFFKALPLPLTVYNVGSVSSIAALAYLGAEERKVSAHATFMLHRTYASPQAAVAERLQAIAKSLILDDQRTETILRQNLKLNEERWAEHRSQDIWFSAEEAVEAGLANSIADFAPPKGALIYSI
jgi:ATP-dependent Clp protease, protease subunit